MKIPFTNLVLNISRNDAKPRGNFTVKGGASLSGIIGNQGVRIAPQNLWAVYRLNADVYSCIRELRNGVGDGGYKHVSAKDPEIEPEKSFDDFLKSFWRNSGGFNEIKSKAVRDFGISGNAYFEIVYAASGIPHSLNRLDPRTMYTVATQEGEVIKYCQRVPGAKDIEFAPHEIWHFVVDHDPDNELLGFSPLETALWEARTDISAAESNYYFFENDAVPSVLYITEPGISEDEQKVALDGIKAQFGGSKNRNKAGMLAGIKEVKTLSMTQKDMEFVVGRKFNTDKVCSVYGVPKFIIGYTETVNYSSGAKLLEKFYRGTIQPLESALANAINNQLFEKIGIREKVVFEFLPQTFGEELETTRLALEEMKAGALTLRQYKVKTGQAISKEDEAETLIDKHIIHNGASAVLLDDVGVDPIIDPNDPIAANSIVKVLEDKFKRYEEEATQ